VAALPAPAPVPQQAVTGLGPAVHQPPQQQPHPRPTCSQSLEANPCEQLQQHLGAMAVLAAVLWAALLVAGPPQLNQGLDHRLHVSPRSLLLPQQ
jgi:hypothetical protein